MARTWRNAKAIDKLREQINAAAPGRNRASDGTIGDAAHAAVQSEHNPDHNGVVRAVDITHDPHAGVDGNVITEAIKASKDPRVLYIIWNHKIWGPGVSPDWRPYRGANPHDHHFHISMVAAPALYDSMTDWAIGPMKPSAAAPKIETKPLLRRGMVNDSVRELQRRLNILVDGQFGPQTEAAVRAFQTSRGLVADGIVGPYTWKALLG